MKTPTEREIFFEALELPTPELRAAYLQAVCGGDVALCRKVDELLKEHFSKDSLLAGSAVEGDRVFAAKSRASESSAQIVGRYKLLERIGEGGFGEVWMAEQREPVKRRVALKILKPGMDSRQVVARFEAERQALAMMDHPNIAKIFDAGVTDTGRLYFVMELVRGIKITEYCDQNQLPTRERLELFIFVCQAIQHAHQKGIIHRDIKPSNVLVTLHDGVPVPKVIDFGIAKATQQELTDKTVFTQFQQFMGTPAYISPEQAEMSGLDVDTRADIYSLGVLLYELLVGRTPFDAKEMMRGGLDALRQIIREKEPLRPSTKLNTLPGEACTTVSKRRQTDVSKLVHQLQGDLDWIVMKCLEKDRTRRYETANGVAADIQRHMNNEPVVARPPSTAYKLHKAWQRNKHLFTAGAVVALALVSGITVSTWQAIQAENTRAIAVEQRKVADVQLALQAWEEGDLLRANNFLEASRPGPGQPPGFEWRYVRKLCQDESIATFSGPDHPYQSAQFFARNLLLLNDEKTLILHDFSQRKEQLLLEDQDGIRNPALCTGNTNLLATMTDHGRIKVWDLAARRVRLEFEGPPRSPPASFRSALGEIITFSRDGKWLASAGSDRSLKLWDLKATNSDSGRTIHRYASWVGGGAFSHDGRRLFTSGSESMIRSWDVLTGAEEADPLEGHTSWVYALAMSPNGLRLASGGADSTVVVWDVLTRKPVTTLFGHIAMINALAFSPDGQTLASAGLDQTIRLWNLATGQQISLLRGQGAAVNWLSFSPDGQSLVSRSEDGVVKLWKTTLGEKYNVLASGRVCLEVAWSPEGRFLASVSPNAVDLWDLSTRSRAILKGNPGVMSAAFSPDGRLLATGSHDETVTLWDVRAQKVLATLTNGFPVGSVAFSPNGQTLIAGGSKHHFLLGNRGGLRFWGVPSRQTTGTIPGDPSGIVQVALSASGSLLGTGHTDGAVSLWDFQSRRLLHRFRSPFKKAVLSLAFSPTEPLLAASDIGGNIVLYNTRTMQPIPPSLKGHTGRVTSLAFTPDGRTLASAGEGGGLKLWHAATHQMALTLKGHMSGVKGVAFSPDGSLMASCGLDGTVRLWPAPSLEEIGLAAKAKNETR